MTRSLDLRAARIVPCALLLTVFSFASVESARGEPSRFVRTNTGVDDERTGLTWRTGAPRFLSWEAAREYCTDLEGSGWRLPSVDELSEVVVPVRGGNGSFALAREVFGRATGAEYWSRSAPRRTRNAARLAVGEDGSVDEVAPVAALAVRCVRPSMR